MKVYTQNITYCTVKSHRIPKPVGIMGGVISHSQLEFLIIPNELFLVHNAIINDIVWFEDKIL